MANHVEPRSKSIFWAIMVIIAIMGAAYVLLLLSKQVYPWQTQTLETVTTGQAPSSDVGSQQKMSSPMSGTGQESDIMRSTGAPGVEQKLIKTGSVEVKVKEGTFKHAFDKAMSIAKGANGYVTNSSSSATDSKLKSGRLTIRIPASKFDDVIEEVKKLGEVQNVQIYGQDVTEEYVDIESRLKNLRAQETLLLRLLDEAKNVEDSINVERRLSEVQGEIEQLTGRQRFLDNQVDYATIDLYIYEPSVAQTKFEWGVIEAFRKAALAFNKTFNGIIIAVGALGPIVIILLLVWSWLARRRSKRISPVRGQNQ